MIRENQEDANENSKFIKNTESKIKPPNLLSPIWLIFYKRFLFTAFLKVIRDFLIFASPITLGHLIRFVKNQNEPLTTGLYYVFLLFFISVFQTLTFHQYFSRVFSLGARIRIASMNLIYKKVFYF